jgi:ATP-dependent Clp protease ATP-binding subunit ClpX
MSKEELDKKLRELAKDLQDKYGHQFAFRIVPPEVAQAKAKTGPSEAQSRTQRLPSFDKTPRQIKRELDRHVIRQDAAKRALANAAFYHYQRVRAAIDGKPVSEEYQKPNVLMVGSTGVGKTLLLRRLARVLGVPFVRGDATKFSKTGYVGKDVESLVRELVREAKGDVKLAETGMIFIDEIDKIASNRNLIGQDITGTGVQTELLKPLEDTDVDLIASGDPASSLQGMAALQSGGPTTINTRSILFIVGGAFPGLEEIVQKRVLKKTMGFGGVLPGTGRRAEWLAQVDTDDFVQFGLLEELMGRLPVRVSLQDLDAEDMLEILTKSEGSILNQHEEDFSRIGVRLRFEDDALRELCVRAEKHKTGARGLVTEFEHVLAEFKYELPDHKIEELLITRETVDDPAAGLRRVLVHAPVERFVHEFEFVTKIRLKFDESALNFLGERAQEGANAIAFCWERLSGCDRALKMVGKEELLVTRKILENPISQILDIIEADRPSAAPPIPLAGAEG